MKKTLLATLVAGTFATPAVFAQAINPATNEATVIAAQDTTEAPSAQHPAQHQHAFRIPNQRIETRLTYLRTTLKITDTQQPQQNNFANVLRSQAHGMDKRFAEHQAQRGSHPSVNTNAIERLERIQSRMNERATHLGEMVTAAKPLYTSFTPEQRQIADDLLAKQERGDHGHFHHRGQRPAA